jgi:hypothetical protein
MWKNLKNVVSAVSDLVVIGSKEVAYQAGKASEATETVTGSFSSKAASLRVRYEADLADRKAGVKKAEVVEETPAEVITVN